MNRNLDSNVSNLMDSLRGVSALIVAFVHSFQIFVLPYFGLYGFAHLFTSWLATYAVVTFFIVSGFMIFMSVQNHSDKSGFRVSSFLKARVLRIYPPLILSLIICISIFLLMNYLDIHGAKSFRLGGELFLSREKISFEWESLISSILLIYNIIPGSPPPLSINGPLWTLSYEWWFYLLAMLLANATTNKNNSARWIPVIFIILLFSQSPAGGLLWKFLAIWGSGYLLGYLYKNKKLAQKNINIKLYTFITLCFLCIILIGKYNTLIYLAEPLQRYGGKGTSIMMFVGLIFTAIIAFMLSGRINVNLLSKTARYSYTLYLIHFPILLLTFGFTHEFLINYNWQVSLLAGFSFTLFTILCASRFSRLVENRTLINQYLNRFNS